MNRIQIRKNIFILFGLVILINTSCLSFRDEPSINGFQFISGVVVAHDRNEAYVMNPDGGVDAIDLSSGAVAWTTMEASKPLALNGNLLICQVESSGVKKKNRLVLVALNIHGHGDPAVAGRMDLPPEVIVSIDEKLNSSFFASAQPSGNDAVIFWEYIYHPIKGVRPENRFPLVDQENIEMGTMPRTVNSSITTGALQMNLTSGIVSPLSTKTELTAPKPYQLKSINEKGRIVGVKGRQFVSMDDNIILNSERINNDTVWNKYKWTIFDRSSNQLLGEMRNHYSATPFFLAGSLLVYNTNLFIRRINNELVGESTKIRAVDLNTGQELWGKEIRDTKYYGPFPH